VGTEDFGESVYFGAAFGSDPHFDERQVTGHDRLMRDVLHVNHIDQLVQIGFDAMCIHIPIGAIHHNGHAGDVWIFSASHSEGFDIEVAAAEQRCHAIQHAGFVFN
jgi:hypothetical protein